MQNGHKSVQNRRKYFISNLVRDTAKSFVTRNGEDVKSDWLANQWNMRRSLGHVRIHKEKMKDEDPEIATEIGGLALMEKTRKTFTDSFLNKI